MKMSLMTRRAGAQLRDVMCLSLWSFCLAAGSCARRRMVTVGLAGATTIACNCTQEPLCNLALHKT